MHPYGEGVICTGKRYDYIMHTVALQLIILQINKKSVTVQKRRGLLIFNYNMSVNSHLRKCLISFPLDYGFGDNSD